MAKVNPIQLQKYLKGIEYPANKKELVKHATNQGADEIVRKALEKLAEKDYKTPAEVNKEIGKSNE